MNLICDDSPPTVAIYEVVKDGSSATVYWTGYDTGYSEAGIHHYESWIHTGQIVAGTSTSATFTGLSDGPYMVTVQAYDKVLNSSTDYMVFWIGDQTVEKKPSMVINQSEDFCSHGPVGGSFTPSSKYYNLRNDGEESLYVNFRTF